MIVQQGFIRDDYAGPGGWSVALQWLGLSEVGTEFDKSAVATARTAGHLRWLVDVRKVRDFPWPALWGYIASPPCQTFSTAGNGAGRKHMASLLLALTLVGQGYTPEDAIEMVCDEALDERSLLVLEPLLVIREHMPVWVAMEQVATVLPIWQAYAEILRGYGYHVATGIVTSEQYGVPQTRKRAILVAHLEHEVSLPAPTHTKYAKGKPRQADGLLPWVSMADALGAAGTLVSRHSVAGIGRASRDGETPAVTIGGHPHEWALRSNYGTGGDPANRGERLATEPAATVTSKADRNKWQLQGNQRPERASNDYQRRDVEDPAQTITSQIRSYQWVSDAQANSARRDESEPAPTITAGHAYNERTWTPTHAHDGETPEDVAWVGVRPSPTIVGSFAPDVVAAPGWRKPGDGPRQNAKGSVRVTVQEAAVLQSFPADYPWQGTKGKRHEQVGNAIPPLLARAILAALLDTSSTTP